MLVLSRKVGEEIRLVEAGVTIKLMNTKKSRAQIAIDAPPEQTVLRGELADDNRSVTKRRSAESAVDRLSDWVDSMDPNRLSDELPVIEDLIERLVELRLAARQPTPSEGSQSVEYARRTDAVGVRSTMADYLVDAELPTAAERVPNIDGYVAPGCECV